MHAERLKFRTILLYLTVLAALFSLLLDGGSSPVFGQEKQTARPQEARQFGPSDREFASDQFVAERGQGQANAVANARLNPAGINVDQMLSPSGLAPTMKIMILLTLLSLVPSILIMTTCFVRFIIVFGLLRQALGTPTLPPNQVVSALALFLTMFVMTPVWQEAYRDGIEPYVNQQPIPGHTAGEDPLKQVCLNTFQPVKRFMSEQIHRAGGEDVVFMLVDYRRPDPTSLAGREWREPETFNDVEPAIIVTAFMLSELKTAFVIGFQVYLPFLIIDMVVSMLLTAMGMMMMTPTLISLPFKLLLFVLVDGWALTVQMLLRSVDPSSG